MKLTGSQIILRVLEAKGVDTIFGYPGGSVISFFDTLYQEGSHFQFIRPSHEPNGVHAADGYARSTGKLGVFFATSGPGATNTVTGIATAFMDSSPVLVITGQVASASIGQDAFQEIDITGVTFSITKHNCLVRKVEQLQHALEDAIDIALSGRPGPVLVDIPKDVLLGECEYKQESPAKKEAVPALPKESSLAQAIQLINASQKPLLYAGGGVRLSGTQDLLCALAEKGSIPVANSFMGLGTIARSHPLSLGLMGMHGLRQTNIAVNQCDLLIAVGARFSDRVAGNTSQFAENAKIIHIDIDEREFDKAVSSHIALCGDLRQILLKLLDGTASVQRSSWHKEIAENASAHVQSGFTPENILKLTNRYYSDNTIVVTDVGQHQMWTAQHWQFQNSQEFVSSGGLGTMGFGLGAAIGAQLGNPDKHCILITGDGSLRMSSGELATLSRYHLPVRVLLLNNGVLGMVRQWQKLFQNARYSQTDNGDDLDYTMLAQANHIKAFRITSLEALEDALAKTKHDKAAVFFECVIDKQFDVFPIVPPGKAIDQMITG